MPVEVILANLQNLADTWIKHSKYILFQLHNTPCDVLICISKNGGRMSALQTFFLFLRWTVKYVNLTNATQARSYENQRHQLHSDMFGSLMKS